MSLSAPAVFEQQSFYDILQIDKQATQQQIKTAYRRCAIKYHPDRNNSPTAKEEFQYLAYIHEILTDEHKRKVYDDTGSVDDAVDLSTDAYSYWRTVFPSISLDDISRFEQSYKCSNMEREDVVEAWDRDATLQCVFECVPFISTDDLERVVKIIEEEKRVKIPKKKIDAFRRSWDRFVARESSELSAAIEQLDEHERHALKIKHNNRGDKANQDDDNTLMQLISARQNSRAQQSMAFLDKYIDADKKNKKHARDEKEPSEEEFAAIQARMFNKSTTNAKTQNKRGKKN